MPSTDPQTTHNPATGQVAPAAWGDAVRDGIIYLNGTGRPRARVYNSGNQAITTATVTAITFDSERVDVGSCHSTSSNTSRLTVPTGEGGWYDIGGNVQFEANATGYRSAIIRLNGTTRLAEVTYPVVSAGDPPSLVVSCKYQLAAADYVELCVAHSRGSNLNVLATANVSPEFWFEWRAT